MDWMMVRQQTEGFFVVLVAEKLSILLEFNRADTQLTRDCFRSLSDK